MVTLDTCGSTRISTLPSGFTRGVTRMVTPIGSYWMFCWLAPVAVSVLPLRYGKFWPDLHEPGLVVGHLDLRAAEHVHPPLGLERPDQQAERVAGRGEHEPAEPLGGRRPAHAQVPQPLEPDLLWAFARLVFGSGAVRVEVEPRGGVGAPPVIPRVNSTGLCRPISTPTSSVVVQLHLGDQHLDHHLRRLGVDPVDDPLDLAEVLRGGADEHRVRHRLGDDHHVPLQLLVDARVNPAPVYDGQRGGEERAAPRRPRRRRRRSAASPPRCTATARPPPPAGR